jgi:hypothetical protein
VSLPYDTIKVGFEDAQTGDILLDPGSPGHAVIISDTAVNPTTKEKIYIFIQSYMPAQDMHIIKNPADRDFSPWYRSKDLTGRIITPEWIFNSDQFRRFR